MRETCDALLIDLDGVLRHFDAAHAADVERRYGLPAGVILGTAMHHTRLYPAIEGRVTHAEWLAGVAEALTGDAGGIEPARAAVDAWAADRGSIDPVVLAFVREVRAAGVPVGLATNATDWLDADLARLGVAGDFDAVVNASVVGRRKPAREYFAAACAALGVPARRCLLVDDDDRTVRGARVAGLAAYRYNGPGDLPYVRAALALPRG